MQAQDKVEQDSVGEAEEDEGNSILFPVHLDCEVNAGQFVDQSLDRAE